MKTVIIVLLLVSKSAFAELCTDANGELVGNTIRTCGIGSGATEQAARAEARKNAYVEFKGLCVLNTKCSENALETTPLKITCTQSAVWNCKTVYEFTMLTPGIGKTILTTALWGAEAVAVAGFLVSTGVFVANYVSGSSACAQVSYADPKYYEKTSAYDACLQKERSTRSEMQLVGVFGMVGTTVLAAIIPMLIPKETGVNVSVIADNHNYGANVSYAW